MNLRCSNFTGRVADNGGRVEVQVLEVVYHDNLEGGCIRLAVFRLVDGCVGVFEELCVQYD
jgi:hypothetical protein